MTDYALTIVGNAESGPLEPAHVEQARECLSGPVQLDWLADGEACQILFDSPMSAEEITGRAREALSKTVFDTVCVPVAGRRKKLLLSDMDSTIINQECIDVLGDVAGVGAQIRKITESVVKGDIGFSDALRKRMALLDGMDVDLLDKIYEDRITLQAGARVFVQTMRHHGAFCVLVSGGFTHFTSRIARRTGFHEHQGNQLIIRSGRLTGEVSEPIVGRSAKLETLTRLCAERKLEAADVLAVGDGANDIKMIEAAGLGVAFHGSDAVRQQANACIDHGDLTVLLYFQGFRKSEFVTT